jgi:hypothetical protein
MTTSENVKISGGTLSVGTISDLVAKINDLQDQINQLKPPTGPTGP